MNKYLLFFPCVMNFFCHSDDQTFRETIYPSWGQTFTIDEVLYHNKTTYQDLIVFENQQFGTTMALDGAIQVTEKDEFIYHESLAHIPAFTHGNVKSALVIGGGDGGLIRELLKHSSIEKITLVELDEEVIRFSKEFLPFISFGAFDDSKVEIIIQDGSSYIKTCEEKFDLILVDSPDPVGEAMSLFTPSFYRDCKDHLNEGGIFANQAGVPFMQPEELTMINIALSEVFEHVDFFFSAIPSYAGGLMAFGFATNSSISLDDEKLSKQSSAIDHMLRYYTKDIHQSAFSKPKFIVDLLQDFDRS